MHCDLLHSPYCTKIEFSQRRLSRPLVFGTMWKVKTFPPETQAAFGHVMIQGGKKIYILLTMASGLQLRQMYGSPAIFAYPTTRGFEGIQNALKVYKWVYLYGIINALIVNAVSKEVWSMIWHLNLHNILHTLTDQNQWSSRQRPHQDWRVEYSAMI